MNNKNIEFNKKSNIKGVYTGINTGEGRVTFLDFQRQNEKQSPNYFQFGILGSGMSHCRKRL